ncbi:MAG: insulinase family protein [Bacteroidetes bacterium]|nr:insulinase family protein [Bacteroidota bacterium]
MTRRLVILTLLLVFALQARAQDFTPIQYEEYTLDNGLTVILHIDRTAPTAMTYCLYRVGSKDEVEGRTGFAHFFEHLMFEGTKNIDRGQIDKLITAAGGVLNASTSFDQTDYFFKVPINQLELALWIESERMMHLVIDSLGVETQRSVVKEELKQRYEGRPFGTLGDNLFKTTFEGTPYEWMPIGVAQDINSASIEEFRSFHDTYYLPNNACLVVGGDLDVAQTRQWIETYFGSIPSGPEPRRRTVVIPEQTEARELVVEEEVTPLPAYIESYVTVDYRNDDAFALELLGNVLSSGKSSRLYQRLVDTEQIALQASSFGMPLDKAGMFAFFAIGNQGVDFAPIEKAIKEEIEKVQKEGITEEEFQKVRNEKETSFTNSFLSLDSKLRKLAAFSLFYGGTDLVNRELEKYMSVTREDIRRVARKYLQPERRNVVKYVVMDTNS